MELLGPRAFKRKNPTTVGGKTRGRVNTTSKIPLIVGFNFFI